MVEIRTWVLVRVRVRSRFRTWERLLVQKAVVVGIVTSYGWLYWSLG